MSIGSDDEYRFDYLNEDLRGREHCHANSFPGKVFVNSVGPRDGLISSVVMSVEDAEKFLEILRAAIKEAHMLANLEKNNGTI